MKNEQIVKIAQRIVSSKGTRVCRKSCYDDYFPIDYLKVNGVEFDLDNNDYWIHVLVYVASTAYYYSEPDDLYAPGYDLFDDQDDEISDDSCVEIFDRDDRDKIIEFNKNDKIEIKFDNNTFKNNHEDVENDILEKYFEKVEFDDDDWEVDYDWYHSWD